MFVQLKSPWKGRAIGERLDVADDDADLLVKAGIADKAPNVTADLITEAVAKTVAAMSAQLNVAIEAALKQFAQAASLSRRGSRAQIFGPGESGDPKKTFGSYLLAVRRGDAKALEEMGSRFAEWDGAEAKAALAGSSGTTGGYTVPVEFMPNLLQIAAERAVVRPRAYKHPMASRSAQVPYLDQTIAPAAGDTAFFGGLVARWTEEAAGLNETEPTFRQMELVAHELSGYSLCANSLLADSAIGLEALLYNLFGNAIAWYEDYAFLRGDGVGKPLGCLSAPCALAINRNTGGQFKLVDAGTMISRLTPGWSPDTLCWVWNPTVIPQLVQMVSAAAGVGWLGNLRDKMPMELLGIPGMISEKLPVLGTAKDVALLDLRYYVLGDRRQVEIAYSEHVKFLNNQAAWRFVHRVDGQPWLRAAITLADTATTVSPFVYLN